MNIARTIITYIYQTGIIFDKSYVEPDYLDPLWSAIFEYSFYKIIIFYDDEDLTHNNDIERITREHYGNTLKYNTININFYCDITCDQCDVFCSDDINILRDYIDSLSIVPKSLF